MSGLMTYGQLASSNLLAHFAASGRALLAAERSDDVEARIAGRWQTLTRHSYKGGRTRFLCAWCSVAVDPLADFHVCGPMRASLRAALEALYGHPLVGLDDSTVIALAEAATDEDRHIVREYASRVLNEAAVEASYRRAQQLWEPRP